MTHHRPVTLETKYTARSGEVLLSGIQALVRLALDQRRRDVAHGLNTAGYISGYRGSPIAGFDIAAAGAKKLLDAHHIRFQPGVNEDLAATAVWGSQQVNLHARAKYDGVFGIWYGKVMGVDRSGDAFKHANNAGTSAHGGVLAIAGDDPRAKSSAFPNQSEFAFVDAEMPILAPADIQDLLDLGLIGFEMSRFSGAWTAMIAPSDLLDGSAVITVSDNRPMIVLPDEPEAAQRARNARPEHALLSNRLDSEKRLRHLKLPAARAFARANRINRVVFDTPDARFGIAAVGMAYGEVRRALELLGIDDAVATRMGLRIFKVAMPWPLVAEDVRDFAEGLETVLVVEHKRPLVETQIKDLAYHWPADVRPAVLGKTDRHGAPLLSDLLDLSATDIAQAIFDLTPLDRRGPEMARKIERLRRREDTVAGIAAMAARAPYFCSGCPHNSSTNVPEGARAMPGVGCHIMAQGMDRTTDAITHMGGEGAPWLGQFPFTDETHMFVNLGDGTYYHSGILAIRAAVAQNAPVTFKILYNDAVAMTGGQHVDGPLDVPQITRQLAAEGVTRIEVLSETPEHYDHEIGFAPGITVRDRRELGPVQEALRNYRGVSALIFDQTCAAEKRRRRKRAEFPDPPKRLFINDAVCDACGDCSVQSNCLSVEPLETVFGTKRKINQSTCNKDFSCIEGFCPSFVSVKGADAPRQKPSADAPWLAAAKDVPNPAAHEDERTYNLMLTGVGGTGVTTVSAILAMAAHIAERQAATLDMTGLAQKGGAVVSHIRIGRGHEPLPNARIATASADAVLAFDLVTASSKETLAAFADDRTDAVYDPGVAPTAGFVRHQHESFAAGDLAGLIAKNCRSAAAVDAGRIAGKLFGDAIFTNMVLLGAAYQTGLIPVSAAAIEEALRLNGVAVEANIAAFAAGRLAVHDADALGIADDPPIELSLEDLIAHRGGDLRAYQNVAYENRYLALVGRARGVERKVAPGEEGLTRAVADNFHRLMAYKDEYEVARLYADPAFRAKLGAAFPGRRRISVHLAPPLLARRDPATGRPKKIEYGPWVFPMFGALKRFKFLRGTPFDPFGRTDERRAERALVEDYEATMRRILRELRPHGYEAALEIARLPERIRGFGPVKAANIASARRALAGLLERFAAENAPHDGPLLEAAE